MPRSFPFNLRLGAAVMCGFTTAFLPSPGGSGAQAALHLPLRGALLVSSAVLPGPASIIATPDTRGPESRAIILASSRDEDGDEDDEDRDDDKEGSDEVDDDREEHGNQDHGGDDNHDGHGDDDEYDDEPHDGDDGYPEDHEPPAGGGGEEPPAGGGGEEPPAGGGGEEPPAGGGGEEPPAGGGGEEPPAGGGGEEPPAGGGGTGSTDNPGQVDPTPSKPGPPAPVGPETPVNQPEDVTRQRDLTLSGGAPSPKLLAEKNDVFEPFYENNVTPKNLENILDYFGLRNRFAALSDDGFVDIVWLQFERKPTLKGLSVMIDGTVRTPDLVGATGKLAVMIFLDQSTLTKHSSVVAAFGDVSKAKNRAVRRPLR